MWGRRPFPLSSAVEGRWGGEGRGATGGMITARRLPEAPPCLSQGHLSLIKSCSLPGSIVKLLTGSFFWDQRIRDNSKKFPWSPCIWQPRLSWKGKKGQGAHFQRTLGEDPPENVFKFWKKIWKIIEAYDISRNGIWVLVRTTMKSGTIHSDGKSLCRFPKEL